VAPRALVIAAGAALCAVLGRVDLSSAGERGAMNSEVEITPVGHLGWSDAYEIDNGIVTAVVLAEVGPRIIDFRLSPGENVFYVRRAEAGGKGEKSWVFRGGWRLWVAPERRETTYALDNGPCQVERLDGPILRVSGAPQETAGIQKRIEVSLARGEPRLHLTSRIRNVGDRERTYAAWSLSVMRPGGRAFVPLDVGPLDAFDSVRRLLLWSYAELSDPRYAFGDRLIQIDHARVPPPPGAASGRRDDESKIGADSAQGWAAYLLGDTLYVKRFEHDPAGRYPDGGATIEVYSSHEFLEVENLGPLTTIAPGEEIVLKEDWWLFSGVNTRRGEKEALEDLQGYVRRAAFP
jgi:hypothetical protein